MMIRDWKVWTTAAIAVLICAASLIYLRQPRVVPRNVLLVTLDTTRADHLGCYGFERALTPVVDQLAREGVTFENAFSSMPLTLPAHASILTGRYPPENGVHENGNARLDESIPTLTRYLRQAGYSTAAFIASMVLDSKHGLDQAFDVYDDNMAGGRRHGAEAHLMRDGNQVVDAGLQWLHGVEGKPFFCWVHLYDAHAPFEGYAELFGDRFRDNPYDGDIAFADVQVGRLVDDLKQRGLYDNTIIVIVGDHGEGMGEHGEEEHGFMLYNSTLRVPLIVTAPDLCTPGHRITESVSVVDILPTILECLGIPLTNDVGGESVAAALRGDPMESHDCYSESIAGFSSFGWAPLTAIMTDSLKYIETTRSELYDLKSDPAELQNLANTDSDSLEEMQRKLEDVQSRMIEFSGGQLEVSESDRRKLGSIGYVSGGKGPVSTDPGVQLPDVKDMMPHYNSEVNARKLIAAGRIQEAIDLMTSVSREVPLFIPARLTLGTAYEAADLPMEAADIYADTIRTSPDSADAHFAIAKLAAAQGDMPTAITHYTRVVEIDPRYATAHFNLGSALFASGNPDAAKIHYEAGLAEFPDSLIGQFNYGVLLAHQNKPEEAIKYLDRAALFSPDNPQIIFQQGLVLSSLGKYAEAAIRFESVLRLNPQYSGAAEKLEEMYRKMSAPE
jgi:arylsulfatase A-like enzyme/Tfp pilus assembly protein PilF